jgi:muconolactone delta-isomerase
MRPPPVWGSIDFSKLFHLSEIAMKILALECDIPGITDDRFTEGILREEATHAWELHQSGVIRELYFRGDRQAAVLVLECESAEEARSVLETLPLVREGLIGFDVIPLTAYPGFARLFTRKDGHDDTERTLDHG